MSSSAKATPQSILNKGYIPPNQYDSTDPLKVFIIQVTIIVAMARLLSVGLSRLRQPRVVSEVITGLILGPSAMGRIPGFTNAIFPTVSIPNLTLIANFGLVFFLFLVGLEADLSVFKRNGRAALSISMVGLVIPFGLGCAVSIGLYHKFIDASTVNFGVFLLFIGTAMSITAFPVLARILAELKLLQNPVGLTVLAAGVGNDVVGWILLALSVALANAGPGATAVYVLLCAVGLALLLRFIVRPVYLFMARKTGSFEHGPTPGMMVLTFFIVLAAAFLTDIIGIHPIFGSFLVGILVVPHHHGFATAMTEKIEDFVSILFIPIYFVLSGLKTDLGLLNSGSIWGWAICVIIVAFVSKFVSCGIVARLSGYPPRESLAVGALMSCKGLVELIVLNVGLNAKILNNQVFAMFVLMALVTTVAATPLALWFYPESYWRPKLLSEGADGSHDDGELKRPQTSRDEAHFRRRFVVVLERFESLPSIMSFVRLLQSPTGTTTAQPVWHADVPSSEHSDAKLSLEVDNDIPASTIVDHSSVASPLSVNAYRLVALTERPSSVFHTSDEEVAKRADPLLNIFGAFANMASLSFTTSLSRVAPEKFAESVIAHTSDRNADLLVVPWAAGASIKPLDDEAPGSPSLETLFGSSAMERSPLYASFVRRVFLESTSDVALYLDGGASTTPLHASIGAQKHIYLPFHGGADDRAALDLVLQLVANNQDLTATVTHFVRTASDALPPSPTSPRTPQFTIGAGGTTEDTVYAGGDTQHRLASETADSLALSRYFPAANSNAVALLAHAAARVTFTTVSTATPMKASLERLQSLTMASRSVLVVIGRSRRAAPNHRVELESYLKEKATLGQGIQSLGIAASSEVRKTLGDLGSAVVVSGQASNVLILQSAAHGGA